MKNLAADRSRPTSGPSGVVAALVAALALISAMLANPVEAQPPLDGGGGWTSYPDPNENTGITGQNPLGEIPANPASFDSLTNIAAAFSNARAVENSDLCPGGSCESGAQTMSTSFAFPSGYSGWTAPAKALWLINSEREARGLLPFAGTNAAIDQVAQEWAQYLADNNFFFHNSDAKADIEAACNGCAGNIGNNAAENLYSRSYFAWPNPGVLDEFGVENAVYLWMYVDRDGEGTNSDQRWGHRHALLWDDLVNDNGSSASEGYIGIGVAKVSATCCGGYEGERQIVVWNAVDSNASWPTTTGSCNGLAVTVDIGSGDTPTAGDDVILGTSGDDTIYALAGDDVVCAGDGADTVIGGPGADTVYGGGGDDIISGNGENDLLYGEAGQDRIFGGSGDDLVEGGADSDPALGGSSGLDIVRGGAGADVMTGGSDADIEVSGGEGNDAVNGGGGDDDNVHGNAGNDTVSGNGGTDVVNGGDGNDEVRGGNGNDIVYGDDGDDFVAGNGGTDTCDGGADTDTAASNCETILNVP